MGADLNSKNNDEETPLIIASFYSYDKETVKILIEAGANLNLKDRNGYTALMMISMYSDNKEIIKLLLNYGADYTIKNHFGKNMLTYIYGHDAKKEVSYWISQIDKTKEIKKINLVVIDSIMNELTLHPDSLRIQLFRLIKN